MSRRCFTLVELLTVVAVIAILAGITIPVVVGMSSKGKEVTARADMNAIKLALTQFKSDYSVWPVPSNGTSDTLLSAGFEYGESGKDDDKIEGLMEELTWVIPTPATGSNAPQAVNSSTTKNGYTGDDAKFFNKKHRKYLDAPAKPTMTESGVSGFYKVDPWGKNYNIAIDTNYDKRLVLSKDFTRGQDDETIVGDIAIFSYGSAEKVEETDAFLYSWKTLADE